MPVIEIRPRRATELVDAGFQLLRRYYPQLLTVTAIAMSPSVIARMMMRDALADPRAIMRSPASVSGGLLVMTLCTFLADAVLIVAVSDGYLEGRVDLPRALRRGARRLPAVIGAGIVRYLMLVAVLIIAAVAGAMFTLARTPLLYIVIVPLLIWVVLYVMLRTFAASSAVLLEGAGPVQAVARSWRLATGCGTHIFCSLGLVWLLYLVIYSVIAGVGLSLLTPSITEIMGGVVIIGIYPLISVVYTLLYYDLRVRKEGFDLEMMSRELGGAASPGGAEPLPAA